MGVWIEIFLNVQTYQSYVVTPFVGVWIEIEEFMKKEFTLNVTPFVGVWIEMIPRLALPE